MSVALCAAILAAAVGRPEPLLAGSALGQQPKGAGRLNTIIKNAEEGKLSFNGESWRMMPDNEHDIFGLIKLQGALAENRPEGSERFLLPAVVRINMEANHLERHRVKQYLDAGLMGLILPQSETLDQVREFITMMRYPPQGEFYAFGPRGVRGWSPSAAARYWGVDMDTYMRKADLWPLNPEGELLALVLLENKPQMENIEKLLELPGLGGVLFGTGDMSMSYGLGTPAPPPKHPVIMANIERFVRACAAHRAGGGKAICGTYQTPQGLETAVKQGLTFFTAARGDFRGDSR
jgi:2-keto-3-deoxy-L-rhamnonate aldolase RhmA